MGVIRLPLHSNNDVTTITGVTHSENGFYDFYSEFPRPRRRLFVFNVTLFFSDCEMAADGPAPCEYVISADYMAHSLHPRSLFLVWHFERLVQR